MSRRREFSKEVKRRAAERAGGKCEMCTARLGYGLYHYDHILPDALGGDPVFENCRVLCITCHRTKTSCEDIPVIAKSRRQKDRAIGIKPKRSITRWRKFDGTPVLAPDERD